MSSTTENEVTRIVHDWTDAFLAKDVDRMMSFYAGEHDFVAFDLMPPIRFHGGAMWRKNWVDFLGAFDGDFTMDFDGLHIEAGDDLAFVRALVHQVGTMGGHDLDLWTRQTIVLRKTDGRWLMVHSHVSVPSDLATGKARLDLSPDHPE